MDNDNEYDNNLDSMSSKDTNEDTVYAVRVSDNKTESVSISRAPTSHLVEQYSYQEGNTEFLQHDVPVVDARLTPSIYLPVTVPTIPDMRTRYSRGGTENYDRISDSSASRDDYSINKDIGDGNISGTNYKRKNVH